MDNEIDKIQKKAKQFIKENKKFIIEKFASTFLYRSFESPITMFMAGSAGAGKTELSQTLVLLLDKKINQTLNTPSRKNVVRIDADEIREMLPDYSGKNSQLFQEAVSLGVNKVFDRVIKRDMNFIMDGTFSRWGVSQNNIKICLDKGRQVNIIYLYQDPELCWRAIKARENKNGRVVPIDEFIEGIFKSIENVNRIKQMYPDSVILTCIKRGYNQYGELHEDVENIDKYININYTKESIFNQIKNI